MAPQAPGNDKKRRRRRREILNFGTWNPENPGKCVCELCEWARDLVAGGEGSGRNGSGRGRVRFFKFYRVGRVRDVSGTRPQPLLPGERRDANDPQGCEKNVDLSASRKMEKKTRPAAARKMEGKTTGDPELSGVPGIPG
eukprot:gene9943-biopygen7724